MAWQQRRPATCATARPPPPPVPTSHATTIVVDPDSTRRPPLLPVDGLIIEINHVSCYDMIEQFYDKIKEAQDSPSKLAALKSTAAASPIPEAIVEERKNYGKSKAGDADSDEEGDTSGEDESNDDEVYNTVTLLK
ncbi:hypothetical protein OsJ_33243 [Oryza sativa Japonica Group]|uniref:Uncharacterized protein n=2 Tax=Oryza sativa subsp. japonica TaxID=39947 RepID=A3C9D7_ORYSJ|nr:hypothetical protein LOC_Os11g08500 [Oryza sativa Japonica Group]ABA91832.1 hypothetical protein LOC_Os11g08500 [Oryza sativa Japonica Group]EAZ17700.1 hypothetical protein OsJ_33243 [Oryza sativa Japonica Group]